MNAAHRYDHKVERPEPGEPDPSRQNLDRAGSRLDLVDCLLLRRCFEADRIYDRVQSIHLYSDSSPVTGEELQGMLMDIFFYDGSTDRVVLPGCTLAYGCFNAVAKSLALVWAAFLVAGPDEEGIRYFFDEVVSIVTDCGTEIKMATVPDVITAFVRWNQGWSLARCAPLVDTETRLFANALRISGWCHAWGNLMKEVAHVCPKWPTVLEQMRCMVAFWRDRTWRKWVQVALRGTDVDTSVLKSFPAAIAKWRFETIAKTMFCLDRLRTIAEKHLRPEMFARAKDAVFMKKVFETVGDREFGIFISAAYRHCFRECEDARHWGMVCRCEVCEKKRADAREAGHRVRLECFMNSRCLAESWPWLQKWQARVRDSGAALYQEGDCEGNRDVYECIVCMLHKMLQGIDSHFGYLGILPWALSRADTTEGALEVMRQVKKLPWDRHDPLTRKVMSRVGGDIERVSQGEPVSTALQSELAPFKQVPLDESLGEGYHRDTHKEKSRATGSTSRHLKQNTRFKRNLTRCNEFVKRYGERGEAVFRYEWRSAKRIVQAQRKNRWHPSKLKMSEVLARVYREDERAEEDFSSICSRG